MTFANIFLLFLYITSLGFADTQQTKAVLSGSVYDSRGIPVKDAQVSILTDEGEKKTFSDKEGKYKITGINKGLYIVAVTFPGFRITKRVVELDNSGVKTLDIGLEIGVISDYSNPTNIFAIVQSSDGKKIKDAIVILLNPFDDEVVSRGLSDKNGNCQFRLQTGGQFLLYAHKPGFKVSAKSINLKSEDIVETLVLADLK